MTDRHVRTAFFELLDGRGAPHPERAGNHCSACRNAGELVLSFEHEFDAVMKGMATQQLPAGTVDGMSTPRVRRMVLGWIGAAAGVLLIVGVALAVPPGSFSGGPTGPSTTESPGSTMAAPTSVPRTHLDEWRETVPQVLSRTSPFQAAIVRDGLVTQAEHDGAQDAYLACLSDAGVVAGPSRDALGIIDGLMLRPNDPNIEVDDVKTRCEQEWYADVWPGWRASVLSGAAEETRALLEEFVNSELKPDFPDDECVAEADASRRVQAALDRLGLPDWSIRRSSYGEGAACVSFSAAADARIVVLSGALAVAEREGGPVGDALERFGQDLLDRCLDRDEATDLLTKTLNDLGATNFSVRADPWGPKGGPSGQEEAYRRHVESGCFVYVGRQLQDGGRTVYELWGPWP